MEQAFEALRESLAREILSKLKASSPAFFERIVVELLVRMGYGGSRKDAGEALGKAGDEGIDGIIKEDRLGLDTIYIQAKRWEQTVGRPEIQKFAGALQGFWGAQGHLHHHGHLFEGGRRLRLAHRQPDRPHRWRPVVRPHD